MRTPRLTCRKPTQADGVAVLRVYGDPRTSANSPLAPMASLADANGQIETWQAHWLEHGLGTWAIAAAVDSETLIGFGGVTWRDFGSERHPNLWYRFAPEAWGQGYATEFAAAAVEHARSAGALWAVHALVQADNPASIRVLENLGMKRLGLLVTAEGCQRSLHYRLEFLQ